MADAARKAGDEKNPEDAILKYFRNGPIFVGVAENAVCIRLSAILRSLGSGFRLTGPRLAYDERSGE